MVEAALSVWPVIDLGVSRQHLYAARHVIATFHVAEKSKDFDGSGFVVAHDGALYLVTSRHVVDLAYGHPKYVGSSLRSIRVRGFDHCSDVREHEATFCLDSPPVTFGRDDDVAVVPLHTASVSTGHACPLTNYYHSDFLATTQEFETDDRSRGILPFDVLAVCGYPELDGEHQQERPVALVGFIASDPAHRPRPMPSLKGGQPLRSANVVLYQGFSRGGASGSPVLAVQRGLPLGGGIGGPPSRPTRLVGINAGRIPGSSEYPSALSYFVRSDSILEILGRLTNESI